MPAGDVANRRPLGEPATLSVYRTLTAAAAPLAPRVLERRLARGKEDPGRIGERRGEPGAPRPDGPLIWVHGASVGELVAALPLVERLCGRGIAVLVTTGTVTSAALARRRLPAGAVHQFIPLDVPAFVARFLDHWRPDLALFVESDLWPNLVIAASERGTSMMLVNGRMSERSFARWRRLPRTIKALIDRFDLCLVRTARDAARFRNLGAGRVCVTGNLKFDVPALPADGGRLKALRDAVAGRTLIAAASTHPGEERVIADAHRVLKAACPDLLTIIAPRHPERGREVAQAAAAAGLRPALRSLGALPAADVDVYVADTLGELGLVYRLAPIVFMGGSLIRHGGQNPIEAIKFGAAVLHGPHVANFAETYEELGRSGGAVTVTGGNAIAAAIAAFINDPPARALCAERARRYVDRLGGALERTAAAIEPYVAPLEEKTPVEA